MRFLILLSGGIGTRVGSGVPKQYMNIFKDKSTINFLLGNIIDLFDKIFVVCDLAFKDEILKDNKIKLVKNGNNRLNSLKNGLKEISKHSINDDDMIFIHEAARPLLYCDDINEHMQMTKKGSCSVTCSEVVDTIFVVKNGLVSKVLEKNNLVRGYNPQSYYWSDIKKNLNEILNENSDLDLLNIMIKQGMKINVIKQKSDLKKITTYNDYEWIKWMICKNRK